MRVLTSDEVWLGTANIYDGLHVRLVMMARNKQLITSWEVGNMQMFVDPEKLVHVAIFTITGGGYVYVGMLIGDDMYLDPSPYKTPYTA